MDNKNIVTFLDSIQRTIIGEIVEDKSSDTIVVIKNPVVVDVVPQFNQVTGQATGQMALRLLPLFFKEFMGDKSEPVYFNYQKNQITQIEFAGGFDFRLYAQISNIFDPSGIVLPENAGNVAPAGDNVIKLFDD